MNLPRVVLVLIDESSSPVANSAAMVVSTLLGIEKLRLQQPIGEGKIKLPKQSLLVLSSEQINRLAELRLHNFDGAVLVLASESFDALKAKHPILCWGQGSHDACTYPWKLPDLLEKVVELVPMEPENLKMLQKELKAADRWYQRRVIPCLSKLEKKPENRAVDAKALASLATIIEQLRAYTPVACHAVVEVRGDSAQIQQHFQILLEQMGQSDNYDRTQIVLLREVFTKWRDLVMKAGEGLGAFS
ncbi:MAG TPA: hypothetical protein DDW76_30740 [Cyanobacteria bacterium UBA11369]|nr:hypothetical protein [Cyanobacteria bacterium UBA11371]HBE31513.1 hypothetical protein [Cyanobacteria bacterium UBA11368]HBE53023.1 hypothetical protein [Cyanobacteria bacterium UBA11369]